MIPVSVTASPPADTETELVAVDAGHWASLNIAAVNRGEQASFISIAITADANPADQDWIEYAFERGKAETLERTGIIVTAGEKVIVKDSTGTVSFRVHGYKEVI